VFGEEFLGEENNVYPLFTQHLPIVYPNRRSDELDGIAV
jgi:hypothetical protein